MARNVTVINLHHKVTRIGSTRVPPQLNNANPPAPTKVDLSTGVARRDWANRSHNLVVVGGYSDGVSGRSLAPALADTDLAALTTALIRWTPLQLAAGTAINSLTYVSGATGAGTPLNQWACVATGDGTNFTVQAVSPDATTAAWAAVSSKTFTMGTPYVVPASGAITWVGLMVKATTVPSLAGHAVAAALVGVNPALGVLTGLNGLDSTTRTVPLALATTVAEANTTNDGKVPYITVA